MAHFHKSRRTGLEESHPGYNIYTQYKFTWKGSMFFCWLFFIIMSSVISTVTNNGEDATPITMALAVISAIGVIYFSWKSARYLAKSFGHGTMFTWGDWVGLALMIATIVLVFGSDKYIGNGSEM